MKTHVHSILVMGVLTSLGWGQTQAQSPAPDANTLINLGRFEEAKQHVQQEATQKPSAESYFLAGYVYLRAGQPDSARSWFNKGIPMDEKRIPLNETGAAITYLAQQDTANANPKLATVLDKSKGKNADILFRIGEAYTGYLTPGDGSIKPMYPKAVRSDKAIDYLTRAAERDKKNAAIQLALGDAHYLNRQAGVAVTRYESALELGMNPARVYQRIGDIYWQGRNLNLAVENYKKAIETNPGYAPAYNQLAELYFLVNRYKEAAMYMDQYVSVSQDQRQATLLRQAQFHFLAKDFKRAISLIDSNRAALGQNPIVYRIEGWAYSSLKEPDKAIENLNAFLQKAPEKAMPDDYKYLGQAYLATEATTDDSVGIGYLEKAAPYDTTENLYSDVARYYYRTKKHVEAVAALDSAARHGFKADVQDLFRYGISNYTLGFQHDSLGKLVRDTVRFARADSALALAQKLSPDYVPTILYRAKSMYYAYPPEEAVRNGKAKPFFEEFVAKVADKEDERNRYKNDLLLAFKYLISYNELVTQDETARNEWLKKAMTLFPDNKELAKIANPAADTAHP